MWLSYGDVSATLSASPMPDAATEQVSFTFATTTIAASDFQSPGSGEGPGPDPDGPAKTLTITGLNVNDIFANFQSNYLVVYLLAEHNEVNDGLPVGGFLIHAGNIVPKSSISGDSLSIPLKNLHAGQLTTAWTGTGSFFIWLFESNGTLPDNQPFWVTDMGELISFSGTNTSVAASKFFPMEGEEYGSD
jgi:hypothetical protein